MGSFQLHYSAADDVLLVDFEDPEDSRLDPTPLNDHILLTLGPGRRAVALAFYSFANLLGVSETVFTSLHGLAAEEVEEILGVLTSEPASAFFDVTDPEGLIARVLAPRIDRLIGGS